MTEEERTGLAPGSAPPEGSAAPPESLQALTEEIERTREELGETVEALVAKADVKARARDKAAEVAGRVSGAASHLKGTASQVKEQAATRVGAASAAAPEPVRRAASRAASIAQKRQVLLAVAVGGAVLAGWLAIHRRPR